MGVRCGESAERSSLNEEDLLGIVCEGTRDSFSMVTRRPRRDVSDWRFLNASMSSLEAVYLC